MSEQKKPTDADLIAELLAACEEAANCLEATGNNTWAEAAAIACRRAIAKAEGRTSE